MSITTKSIAMALCASALIAGLAHADTRPDPSPAEVVAAERAFTADGQLIGRVAAFKKHAAPDGIVFTPAPANAQETLKSEAEEPKDLSLKWWPVWAGISRSGDLGFTTGPYTARDGKSFGHYFTVWKKQNDGTWKWIFDGGVRNDAASPNGPTTEPTHLQLASGAYNYPEAAWGQVAAIEDELAKESAGDAKAALLKHLAEDAHIMSSREQPAVGAAAIAAELDRRAKTIAFKRLGGATSKQGDMIFTYGDAEWAEGADKRQGHYVRIWQKRTAGWRIVFDEIVANPKVQ